MVRPNKPENEVGGPMERSQKLMASWFICPDHRCVLSIKIQRGMPILSQEGFEAGKVAAIVLDGEGQRATHILLGRLPERSGYWYIPVDLIEQVRDEHVWLSIPAQEIESLPKWRSG